MRKFKVGTYCQREDANNRGKFTKSDIVARVSDYHVDGPGCCIEYHIEAESPAIAKRLAVAMRLRDEQHNVELKGWEWWKEG